MRSFLVSILKQDKCCLTKEKDHDVLMVHVHWSDFSPNVMRKYIGFKNMELVPQNLASGKYLSTLYNQFKAELSLPCKTIERIYLNTDETRYLRWFFSETEVESFCIEKL